MIQTCPNVLFEITPTVSSLNIEALPALHQNLVQQGLLEIDNIYLNILERPKNYNIQTLIDQEKSNLKKILEEHIEWLVINNANNKTVEEFSDTINYLMM